LIKEIWLGARAAEDGVEIRIRAVAHALADTMAPVARRMRLRVRRASENMGCGNAAN
jgi:hypothetical protein